MQKYLLTNTLTFFFLVQAISQSINPQVLWATYFGSQGEDWAGCVETDHENNIYITSTVKNGAGFICTFWIAKLLLQPLIFSSTLYTIC